MKTNITIELNPINCGIYEFRHVETDSAYVGSAIDVRSRIAQHFKALSKGNHYNRKAQELYDSSPSGNSAFEVRLIESCSVEEMDDLEDSYIQSGRYRLNTGTSKFGRVARRSNPPKRKSKQQALTEYVKPLRKTRSDKKSDAEKTAAKSERQRLRRSQKRAAEAAASQLKL